MIDESEPGPYKALTVAPRDRWRLAYIICFLQGMGMLFPWNVFINAENYFHNRFCGTSYADNFLNFYGLGFNISNLISLLVAMRYQQHIRQRLRVVVPLTVSTIIFTLTTIFVLIEPSTLSGNTLFVLTLLSVIVLGSSTAFLQGGIFGLTARFPFAYTNSVMQGQGLAGVAVAVANIVTIAAAPANDKDICETEYSSVKWSAFAYFLIATLVVFSCIIAYGVFERLEFVKYYMNAHAEDEEALYASESGASEYSQTQVRTEMQAVNSYSQQKGRNLRHIFSQTGILAFSVWLVFTVTLAVFPSVTAKIKSTDNDDPNASRFFKDLWVPFSFVIFNLGDYIGRILAGWKQLPNSKAGHRGLAISTIIRIAFIPFFLYCNIPGSSLSATFNSDVFAILLMLVFSMSNGYFASVSMMFGPQQVASEDQENAGTMMVTFLTAGLLSGSLLSFAFIPLTN